MEQLITTTAQLKKHLGNLQKNIHPDTILPFVQQAQDKYLVEAVGPELIDHIATGGINTFEQHLFFLLERALSYFALLEACPFLTLQAGDAGLSEVGNQHTGPVRQWTYNNLEQSAYNNGDSYLDVALQFLEDNAVQFPVWTNSDSYANYRDLLITSTRELSKIIKIGNSRRTFLMLRTYIDRAETIYIKGLLGPEMFEELKSQLLTGSLTADNKDLVGRINKALGNFALAEALPEITVQITSAGVRVLAEHDGIRQKLAANRIDVEGFRSNAERVARIYLADLDQYLKANVVKFPTYAASQTYLCTQNKQAYNRPDNRNSPSFTV